MSGFFSEIIADFNTGAVSKLTITGFGLADETEEQTVDGKSVKVIKNAKETGAAGKFVAYYNPATFTSDYAIEYQDDKELGDTKISALFNKYTTTTYGFDLLLDGTKASIPNGWSVEGKDAVPSLSPGNTIPADSKTFVQDQIALFKQVAYDYNSQTHRPNFLELSWGGMLVPRCVLTTLGISYDLFDANGNPLRAKLACKFKEFSTRPLTDAEKNSKSPDMTHVRTVRQGDKLPLMCERIYGDAKLYLEVARYNGLTNYRKLEPGQKLYFPPLLASKS
jgi:nucleoid-associated protein YgaU